MTLQPRCSAGVWTLVLAASCAAHTGCEGGMVGAGEKIIAQRADALAPAGDAGLAGRADALAADSGAPDAASQKLPSKPGDVCPLGKCAGKLLCIGAICHAPCDQPNPHCNERVSACGASQACLPASSFTDACFPAANKVGGTCGRGLALCPGGSLCVRVGAQAPRCLKLCKYGCNGRRCVPTSNGCQICL